MSLGAGPLFEEACPVSFFQLPLSKLTGLFAALYKIYLSRLFIRKSIDSEIVSCKTFFTEVSISELVPEVLDVSLVHLAYDLSSFVIVVV